MIALSESVQYASGTIAGNVRDKCEHYLGAELYRMSGHIVFG